MLGMRSTSAKGGTPATAIMGKIAFEIPLLMDNGG
jgi:hypothetical protein